MIEEGQKPHRNLRAWQASINLVTEVYARVRSFPPHERYGLVSQMQRCATSIPSNIAEGAARKTRKEYVQFLYVARGSLSELDTDLEISTRLGYLDEDKHRELTGQLNDLSKMLNGLIRSLQ